MSDQTRQTKTEWSFVLYGNTALTDKMKLFKSTFVPDQNSVLADFAANEVDFTGYAAYVMAADWTYGLDITGNIALIYLGLGYFSQTDIIDTDIAGGWWIEDTGGTVLKAFNNFTPFSFDRTGNTLLVKPSLGWTVNSDDDVEFTIGP